MKVLSKQLARPDQARPEGFDPQSLWIGHKFNQAWPHRDWDRAGGKVYERWADDVNISSRCGAVSVDIGLKYLE